MNETVNKINLIFINYPYLKTVLVSIILVVIIYLLKILILSSIGKKDISSNEMLLLKRKIGQYANYILIILLLLLWFSQLQSIFVSLIAVAAALVLATKEVIMCFNGGLFLKTSGIFKIGDRIEINGNRGFVIEKGLMATKILEIGPEKFSQQTTGNIISFPNSLVFSNTLKNESYFKGFSIKSYFFKVEDRARLSELESYFLEEGQKICSKYIQEAEKSISRFCEKEGIAIPSVAPRTKLIIEENNDIKILLKLPVRNIKIGDIEQNLNRGYIEFLEKNKSVDGHNS